MLDRVFLDMIVHPGPLRWDPGVARMLQDASRAADLVRPGGACRISSSWPWRSSQSELFLEDASLVGGRSCATRLPHAEHGRLLEETRASCGDRVADSGDSRLPGIHGPPAEVADAVLRYRPQSARTR